MFFSEITAYGHYLPETLLKNDDLKKIVDTSDEWIFSRTGIKQRHIAEKKEFTSHLAIKASEDAFNSFNMDPKEIDCIIIATTTPDNTFPSTATKVQNYFKISNIPSFDIQAVCSGFIYGIQIADSFIQSGKYKKILLVGAETLSKIIDWKDRRTCVLFGDGAGALILSASNEQGIISSTIGSDGSYKDLLTVNTEPEFIEMKGNDVFKIAVNTLGKLATSTLDKNNMSVDQIDWLIPHQANSRIIKAIAKKISLPMDKVIMTVNNHGNTSAASIPLALDHANNSGLIKTDNIIMLEAFGAGFTWGSTLLRF